MPQTSAALERFRNNPLKQLNALSNDCEQATMQDLAAQGFTKLAMHFAAPMSLLGQRPHRLTELAQRLAMSKQLCLQSLRPLSEAGYIARQADPLDKRAKLIALSPRGNQLIAAANQQLVDINERYVAQLGSAEMAFLSRYAQRVCIEMAVPGFEPNRTGIDEQLPFSMLIGMINRSLQRHLMQGTIARGHPHLQMTHGQVLACLAPEGSSVGELAQANGVSSQAISRVARQLDELGYVERHSDPADGRSQRLHLTEAGVELIDDAVSVMTELERRLQYHLGDGDFQRFCMALQALSGAEPQAEVNVAAPLSVPELLTYAADLLDKGQPSADLNAAVEKRLGGEAQTQLNALLRLAVGTSVG